MSHLSAAPPLFAAAAMPEVSPWVVAACVVAGVVVLISLISLMKCYKRCPSNKILVKWGGTGSGNSKHAARCIHGGATFVIPVLQDYAYLSLEPLQIEVPLRGALSLENIRVNVPSVFTVAIGTEPEVMSNASVRLLGLRTQEINEQAADIIFGQLRQVIASMGIEDINRDRDTFLDNVQESLEPELRKIGLVLINVNITDITDDSGYIEAIGKKAASTAINQAEIDVAQQHKLGAVGVAKAEQERSVQVADAEKVRDIGIKTAERERVVEVAELTRAQQVGLESAQFQQKVGIAEAEKTARIQMADANAGAVSGENEAQAVVANSNAELAVKKAEAYQLGETSKREAEAAVLAAQYEAQAIAAEAEGRKVEAEQRAKLEALAKAEKAKQIVDAEARAEKQRIEAEGEASAIYARLEAEARGQYEILSKKADGLGAIVSACGSSEEAFRLMMLEHINELSQTAATAISNIKFDKVIVWENGGADGKGATSGFLQNMANSLPPMMQIMQDIGGVKMPDYFAQMQDEQVPATAAAGNGVHHAEPVAVAADGESAAADDGAASGNRTKLRRGKGESA